MKTVRKPASSSIIALLVLSTSASLPLSADIVDSINPNGFPPEFTIDGTRVDTFYSSTREFIGWYYTPSLDYELTRIESRFKDYTESQITIKDVTISLFTERPTLGGTLLTSGVFGLDVQQGGVDGADVDAVTLSAGERYFLGFSNISGIGVNIGTWEPVNEIPTLSNGSTTALDAWYSGDQWDTESTEKFVLTNQETVRIAPSAPLVFFHGTAVPEPSGILPLFVCALLTWQRRSRSVAWWGHSR